MKQNTKLYANKYIFFSDVMLIYTDSCHPTYHPNLGAKHAETFLHQEY